MYPVSTNNPMVKIDDTYVFGVSVHSNHILIAPFNAGVIEQFRDRLSGYSLNKKTIKVPIDWDVDADLICDMVDANLA